MKHVGWLGLLVACSQDVGISKELQSPPVVAITAPEEGDTVSELDVVEFAGLVSDGNGINDVVELSWSSDVDGLLANLDEAAPDPTGLTRFATTLSVGTHAITLAAVDAAGLTGETSVAVIVELADYLPTAEISVPLAFAAFDPGVDIQLVGSAYDPNQAPETLTAEWSFEPLGGGPAVVIGSAAPSPGGSTVAVWIGAPIGSQRVLLTVIDADGNEDTADVAVEIRDPNAGDLDGDGWTVLAGDCDDADATVAPGLDEACDTKDNDCNGEVDDKDLDSDGHVDEGCFAYVGPEPVDDCDDENGTVFLGAAEQGDMLDNDCNGIADDGLSVFDNDGDCFCTAFACSGSINAACVTIAPGDCDDTDPALHPLDADGDGASTCTGDCDDTSVVLNANDLDGDGQSTCAGDCDDADPLVSGDDVDNDGASACAGDCDDNNAFLNVLDADSDGASTCAGDCNDGSAGMNLIDIDGDGFTSCGGDCNDYDPVLTPFDVDGDGVAGCSGDCDDSDATLNIDDADSDGFTTCNSDCDDADPFLTPADVDLDGSSTCGGDCDDLNASLNPNDADVDGASSCAGDCNDASSTLNLVDVDGDGWSTCAGDCDDAAASLELDDTDADGWTTCGGDCDDNNPLLEPADLDVDGFSTCDGDCNDVDAGAKPGGIEIAYNGRDDDCVGGDLVDVDLDGYNATVAGGTDCNDNNGSVSPGDVEACNSIDDDCDLTIDEVNASGCSTYYLDNDNDGYGTTSSRCLCNANDVVNYDAVLNTDCYDSNADVRPNQTLYFYDDRGDGSWDYNCDLLQSKVDNRTAIYSCNLCGFLNTSCCYNDGWLGSAPACGQTINWGSGCFWVPVVSCDENSQTPVDQLCR